MSATDFVLTLPGVRRATAPRSSPLRAGKPTCRERTRRSNPVGGHVRVEIDPEGVVAERLAKRVPPARRASVPKHDQPRIPRRHVSPGPRTRPCTAAAPGCEQRPVMVRVEVCFGGLRLSGSVYPSYDTTRFGVAPHRCRLNLRRPSQSVGPGQSPRFPLQSSHCSACRRSMPPAASCRHEPPALPCVTDTSAGRVDVVEGTESAGYLELPER